ncbi:MAG TPA: ABC transporter permease [Chloroflexota bacterium]|jgi:peptide/nickel transport system permease protein
MLKQLAHALNDNRMLVAGVVLIVVVLMFGVAGSWFVTRAQGDVGAGRPARPPSFEHLLGTDQQGRDVLANLIFGTPATLKIGIIAGLLGVGVGTLLGVVAGYVGGTGDAAIRLLIDVFLTIPNLMVLVVIASMLSGVSVEQMGVIIAALAWMRPARTVRSQVLTIRERAYVHVARLNGVGPLGIVVRELLPNLLPFLAASLVGSIAAAILASIGLSALGLGPQNEPSIGLTIYWAIFYGALIRQLWWWFIPPIIVTVILFTGLFLTTAGLDRIANPRLRTTV